MGLGSKNNTGLTMKDHNKKSLIKILTNPIVVAIFLAVVIFYATEGVVEFIVGMTCIYGAFLYFLINKTKEKNEPLDVFSGLSMQEKPLESSQAPSFAHIERPPSFSKFQVLASILLIFFSWSAFENGAILLSVGWLLIAFTVHSPARWLFKKYKPNSYFWLASVTLAIFAILYSKYTILGIVPLIITATTLLPPVRLAICHILKMQMNAAILLSLAISLPAPSLIINAVTAFELNEKNTAIENEKIAQALAREKQLENEKLRQKRILAEEQKAKEDKQKQQAELEEFIKNPTPKIQEIKSLISKKDYKSAQNLYAKFSPSNNKELIALKDPIDSAYAFTEDDFYWHDNLIPYKKIIIKGVNKIHKEDARCKEIEPATTYISRDRSSSENPVFFVTCGYFPDAVNVFFSKKDVEADEKFKAPVHIDKAIAVDKCEAYAKSEAAHPSTVNFSRIMSLAVTEHKNGNTTVFSTFTAKNSYNLELKYHIKCLVNAEGLIEANINEAD